jgi:hypothetical protein
MTTDLKMRARSRRAERECAQPVENCGRVRESIDATTARESRAWVAIVGLTVPTQAQLNQFREDIATALHACVQAHIADAPGALHKERNKKLREEFLAHHRERIAALEKLRDAFTVHWPPSYFEFQAFSSHPHLAEHQQGLDALAEAMRLQADEFKVPDSGGRPMMRAFKALAKGLVKAYRRATGLSGAGHGARGGPLFDLTRAVLPVADKIAREATGKPLKIPASANAIGDHLHRIASANQVRAKTPKKKLA